MSNLLTDKPPNRTRQTGETYRDWTNCSNNNASIIDLIPPGSSQKMTIKVILIHNIYQSNYLVCDEYLELG